MKHRLASMSIALALVVGLLVIGRSTALAGSFKVYNQGNGTVYHLYVSRHSDSNVGPDVLGDYTIPPGTVDTLTFPPGSFDTCYWDIIAVYTDAHIEHVWNEDLCSYNLVLSY